MSALCVCVLRAHTHACLDYILNPAHVVWPCAACRGCVGKFNEPVSLFSGLSRSCDGDIILSTRTNRPTHRAVQEGNAIHLSVCSDWSDLNFPLWWYDTLLHTTLFSPKHPLCGFFYFFLFSFLKVHYD